MSDMSWLSSSVSDTWDWLSNHVSASDVGDALATAGKGLAKGSKAGAASTASIIGRGANVAKDVSANTQSRLNVTDPAPVYGLNKGFDPIFKGKSTDDWNYMFRRILQDNTSAR